MNYKVLKNPRPVRCEAITQRNTRCRAKSSGWTYDGVIWKGCCERHWQILKQRPRGKSLRWW